MPFFRQNQIDLAGLEFGIIEVNGSKMSISKSDMNMDMDESSGNTEILGMISRKRLKKELKCGEIEELYLATIQEVNDVTNDEMNSISASTVRKLDEIPKWIRKDYGIVFREELSS